MRHILQMYLSISVRNISIAKKCLDCNKYEIIE